MFNIPDTLLPSVLTASATLTGAFIGACVAQFFSHRLTLSREKSNTLRTNYQKLYAPILLKTFVYYDVTTQFKKDPDCSINPNVLLQEIHTHIGENLMYAPPRIISTYHEIKKFEYNYDGSGFHKDKYQLQLLEELLDEVSKINIFDKAYKGNINKYKLSYYLYQLLLEEYQNMEISQQILKHDFYFDATKLTKNKNYKLIKYYYNLFRRYSIFRNRLRSSTDFADKIAPHILKRLTDNKKNKQDFIDYVKKIDEAILNEDEAILNPYNKIKSSNVLNTADEILDAIQYLSNEERWKLLDEMYFKYYNSTSHKSSPIKY
ncbi:hypothetical protein [Bacillus cereus]|uniref:hypothetical protein n=1 Tax=Bacillus cereus TaxID=1396 RepID=UPI000BEB428E|nr:hypothetical protein [Bacillus cereus]PEC81955.1 hypothetical protein CON28_29030 [Bacillus cereus]